MQVGSRVVKDGRLGCISRGDAEEEEEEEEEEEKRKIVLRV